MNLIAPIRVSLLLLCALAVIAIEAGTRRRETGGTPPAWLDAAQAPRSLLSGGTVPDLVDRVTPAVVSIYTTRGAAKSSPTDPLGLFGSSSKVEQGLGSGVIARSDGVIVTNHHVVEAAAELRVVLSDRRELRARVLGSDPQTDLALLRVEAEGLPTVAFGDSARVRVGETVLAIGNSLGMGQTVSCGILTAKDRGNVGIVDDEDFLQTDAAVNPGNSGGPLLNLKGEMIGINTAIASRNGGFQGIGFAIPSRMVGEIMEVLLRDGRVSRGQLGVVVQDLTPALARAFQSPQAGVIITDLPERGAAREAGLRRGDLILKVDGAPVESTSAMRHRVAMRGGGAKVRLEVWRDRRILEFVVRLKELDASSPSPDDARADGARDAPLGPEGIVVVAVTREMLRKVGIGEEDGGLIVTSLPPTAALAGLRRGDLVVEVCGKTVRKVQEFRDAVAQSADPVLFRVRRPEGSLYVSIPKGSE
jgi:serine protease Do